MKPPSDRLNWAAFFYGTRRTLSNLAAFSQRDQVSGIYAIISVTLQSGIKQSVSRVIVVIFLRRRIATAPVFD